MSDVRCTKKN